MPIWANGVAMGIMPVLTETGMRYNWSVGFVAHVITGVMATGVHYLIMWALLKAGLSPLAASSLGFVGGAVTRFFLSYFHVFAPQSSVPSAAGRFVLVLALQMALNAVLLAGLMQLLPLWWAQLVTTAILTVFNYVAHRLWVFT